MPASKKRAKRPSSAIPVCRVCRRKIYGRAEPYMRSDPSRGMVHPRHGFGSKRWYKSRLDPKWKKYYTHLEDT